MTTRLRKNIAVARNDERGMTAGDLYSADNSSQSSIRRRVGGPFSGEFWTHERLSLAKECFVLFMVSAVATYCVCGLRASIQRASYDEDIIKWAKHAEYLRQSNRANALTETHVENTFMYYVKDTSTNCVVKFNGIIFPSPIGHQKKTWTDFEKLIENQSKRESIMLANLTEIADWLNKNRYKEVWLNIECREEGCFYILPSKDYANNEIQENKYKTNKSLTRAFVRAGFHMFHPLTNFTMPEHGDKRLCAYTKYSLDKDKKFNAKCSEIDEPKCNESPMSHTGAQCGMCTGQIRGDRGTIPPFYMGLGPCDYYEDQPKERINRFVILKYCTPRKEF